MIPIRKRLYWNFIKIKVNYVKYVIFGLYFRRCRLINNICDGEDCYNKPSAYTYNFITFVSKLLIPPEGRTFFSFRGPAWYDDIEFDMKIVKIQTAANIEKATYNHFG